MTDTPSADDIAAHYTAMGHSVDLLNAGKPADMAADEWTATIDNIDDTAAIYVNGTQVIRCGYSESCTVKLNNHLKAGTNAIRLEYGNRFGVWTYGYKVHKNKRGF